MYTQTNACNTINARARLHTHTHTHTHNSQILIQIHLSIHTYTHIILYTRVHERANFLGFKSTQTYTSAH